MRWPTILQISALALLAVALVQPVRQIAAFFEAGDDPAAHADLQLRDVLTPARLSRELEEALAAPDEELAQSLVELAGERGIIVEPTQLARLAELRASAGKRNVQDFASGFLHGDSETNAALSGALAADVTGFGDLRDLAQQGQKLAKGEDVDQLVVGLAAAGLAVSVVTWTTVGAALPARGGMSFVKSMQKAGRLSKPLAATLTKSAVQSFDQTALKASVAAAGRLDLMAARSAAQRVIRPAGLAQFRQLGQDTATIYARTGTRGARQVLAVAESGTEIRQAARIAAVKGTKTRAVLKVLGRGALVAASLSMTLVGWAFSFIVWLFALALFARRFGLWVGRLIWCRRKAALAQGTTSARRDVDLATGPNPIVTT